jgi:hypothetical protein
MLDGSDVRVFKTAVSSYNVKVGGLLRRRSLE